MKTIRKILPDALLFFFGSVLGVSLMLNIELNSAPSAEQSYSMVSSILYSYWSRRAALAMKVEDPTIALWALENDVALSEHRLSGATSARPHRPVHAAKMALDYSRLCLLHAVLGEEEKLRFSVRRAIEWSMRHGSSGELLSKRDVIGHAVEYGDFGPKIKSLLMPDHLGEENAPPYGNPSR